MRCPKLKSEECNFRIVRTLDERVHASPLPLRPGPLAWKLCLRLQYDIGTISVQLALALTVTLTGTLTGTPTVYTVTVTVTVTVINRNCCYM